MTLEWHLAGTKSCDLICSLKLQNAAYYVNPDRMYSFELISNTWDVNKVNRKSHVVYDSILKIVCQNIIHKAFLLNAESLAIGANANLHSQFVSYFTCKRNQCSVLMDNFVAVR